MFVEDFHVSINRCISNSPAVEEDILDSAPGLLLLLIHASGKEVGKERRDAIRATWVSEIDAISEELGQEISYK